MARFFGAVGFAGIVETAPDVHKEIITERQYFGDFLRNVRRLQSSSQVNDDITISNEISIVADPYAMQNFHAIRYIEYMGVKWKVASVEVQYPRLIFTTGGVYNGTNGPRSG